MVTHTNNLHDPPINLFQWRGTNCFINQNIFQFIIYNILYTIEKTYKEAHITYVYYGDRKLSIKSFGCIATKMGQVEGPLKMHY